MAPLPAGRGWIEFSGTAGQVEHAFHTDVHLVATAAWRARHSGRRNQRAWCAQAAGAWAGFAGWRHGNSRFDHSAAVGRFRCQTRCGTSSSHAESPDAATGRAASSSGSIASGRREGQRPNDRHSCPEQREQRGCRGLPLGIRTARQPIYGDGERHGPRIGR